ncbi:hypothetical protein [Methanosarcina sp. 2.H.A.1B.4]|uniref:hypothetical protein n=1 Tax=Methanosarcina sp. 2.H.A.1B.4 TaxID=1483600 RepID=UPI00138DF635|nr:hypothetical protein [Methanosarcina sp. 2.H.A.1B.4]
MFGLLFYRPPDKLAGALIFNVDLNEAPVVKGSISRAGGALTDELRDSLTQYLETLLKEYPFT